MSEKSHFEVLKAINVNDKTEKKGRFTYLSWVWAVDVLLTHDPLATWNYNEPMTLPDGTMMVFCTVTAFGKPMTMQLPVINNNNRPIPNPNSFDVNTAMQRCLVKAIALHGLGLYIYAGEDVPTEEPKTPHSATDGAIEAIPAERLVILESYKSSIVDAFDAGDIAQAHDIYQDVSDNEEKVALWALLKDCSKVRSAIKKYHSEPVVYLLNT